MALRVDFGGDYSGYFDFYDEVQFSKTSEHGEIGYIWLNRIMPSYRMLLITTSLFFCGALFFLFSRYIPTKFWAFAFLILFITKSMIFGNLSGIRNGIAVSAFIFSIYFLEINKKIPYLVILMLASFFHTSSLFFIPLVFINSNRLTLRNTQLLWVIVIVFGLVTTFLPNIINLFSVWLISNISYFSKYDVYMEDEVSYGFRGLSFILIFFMFYMNIDALKNKKLRPREILLIKLSLLFYIVMLLPGIGLLSRMYFYLSFPQLAGNIYVMHRLKGVPLKWSYIFGMLILPLLEFYNYATTLHFREFILNYHSIISY